METPKGVKVKEKKMKVRVRLNCRTRNYTYGTADYGYSPKGGVEVIDALPQVGEVNNYDRKLVGINELRLDPEQPDGESANYDFYELEYVDIDEIDKDGHYALSDVVVDLVAVKIREQLVTVTLFGLNDEVEYDEEQDTFIDDETGYEIYVTTDGRWIANDDAISAWVQIKG